MKFFIAILTIAVLAQVSFAASIRRSERDVDNRQNSISALKDIVVFMVDLIENVDKEMPDTDAYNKYKIEMNSIVKMYNTQTKSDELCIEKLGNISYKVSEFFENLEKEDSEESKKVLELFDKYKSEKVKKQLVDALESAREPKFSELLEDC